MHAETQDTKCDAWVLLEELIQNAALNRAEEFAPGLAMPPEMWSQIIILPTSIKQLKFVKRLYLYSSHLIQIPVEIGEMTNLVEFDAYTSYRLHWFPYEITRCQKLKRSRISTRALYGNYKYRLPFPQLKTLTTSNEVIHNRSVCARLVNCLSLKAIKLGFLSEWEQTCCHCWSMLARKNVFSNYPRQQQATLIIHTRAA